MRIMVTGATGFLGSYLIPALLEQGHDLTILIRNPSALAEAMKGQVRAIQGDVTDPFSVDRAVDRAEAVFHLAAAVAGRRSEVKTAIRINETGTRNVVEASLKNGVSRLVHVSSVAAIGATANPNEVLTEESINQMVGRGFTNFDSKAASEKIVLDACHTRGLDAVIVNPSMIFGAGDARKAARKGSVLATEGRLPFYPSGGISVVSADDVVEGMIRALTRGKKGERYILSGENLRFKDVLEFYARLSGKRPPRWPLSAGILGALGHLSDFFHLESGMTTETATAAGVFHWYDHAKASRELGFSSHPAEVAIRASAEWILAQRRAGKEIKCRDI